MSEDIWIKIDPTVTPWGVVVAPVFNGDFDPPNAITGDVYSYSVAGMFTGGAVVSYLLNGSLPDGLTLNEKTGLISGVPTTAQALIDISVTGTNSAGRDDTNTADIIITEALQAPVASGVFNPPDAQVGDTYLYGTASLFTGDLPDNYSIIGTLPAGIIFNPATGLISGVPTAAETVSGISIIGVNAAGTGTTNSADIDIGLTVQAPLADGTFDLLNSVVGTTYSYDTAALFGGGGVPTLYMLNGQLPAGLALDPITGLISGTVTTAETQSSISITGANSVGSNTTNTDDVTISEIPVNPPVATGTFNPPDGSIGSAYSYDTSTLFGGGMASSYALTGTLPAGLSFNTVTGLIDGSPTTAETASGLAIAATNVSGSDTTNTADIQITSPLVAPVANGTFNPPDALVGQLYSYATANLFSGGIVDSYSLTGTLPAGLSLNTSTGVISGTPATVETPTGISVTGTNGAGSDATNTADIAITSAPVSNDFYGTKYIDTASLIPAIHTMQAGGDAPFALLTSAKNTTGVATRLRSTVAANIYMDTEYRWEVTNLDTSAITYHNEIIDNRIGKGAAVVNPYTDTVNAEGTFMLHEPGSYTCTLQAKGAQSGGQFLTTSVSITVVVTEPVVSRKFYDFANGNNVNDGNDPWGFDLTSGVFTHSTKRLVQSGKFTGYDHAAATAGYRTENYNFIYVDGHGLYRIVSKISNDEVELETSLGSDQTGLTSSDGAKQTFDGNDVDNQWEYFSGGASDSVVNTYDVGWTGYHLGADSKIATKGHVGYNGTPVYTSSNRGSGLELIEGYIGSGKYMPSKVLFWNVEYDLNFVTGYFSKPFSTAGTDTLETLWIQNVIIKGSANNRPMQVTYYSAPLFMVHWAGSRDNLKHGNTVARASAYYSEYGSGCTERWIGTVIDAEGDDVQKDHYIYPKGSNDHFHAGWVYFRQGINIGYAINNDVNNGSGAERKYLTAHDCQQDGGQFFWDCSAANNLYTHGKFSHMCIDRNYSLAGSAFIWQYNGRSYRARGNHWSGNITGNGSAFNNVVDSSASSTYEHENNDWLYEDNLIYGAGLVADTFPGQLVYNAHGSVEANDNIAYELKANAMCFAVDKNSIPSGNDVSAEGNNFYAPSDSDGLFLSADGSRQNLADFNASIGATNFSSDPGWNDPANGDFTTSAPIAPVLSGTLTFPDAEDGEVYSFSVANLFTGGTPTSFTLEAGSLGSGIAFNTVTGVFSGTASGTTDLTGLSVSATNGAGTSSTSNTDDLTVNVAVATAPVLSGTLTLPDGIEGVVYSYDASGIFTGDVPTSYTLESGVMGSEITFNTATCVFSSASALTVDVPDLTGISISASNSAATPSKSSISNTADIVINAAVSGSNLYTETEDLSDVLWLGGGLTKTDQGGGIWQLNEGTGNSEHHMWQDNVSSAGEKTTSWYVKYDNCQYVGTRYRTAADAWVNIIFDIQNGTVHANGGSDPVAVSISAADGNGYRRIEWTLLDAKWNFPKLAMFNAAGDNTSYTGTDRTVLVQHPQHEAGTPATTYQAN